MGFPRSGTRYCSRFLQELGLDVPHERIGENGGSGHNLVDDAEVADFDAVVHLVRDPRAVIASNLANFDPCDLVDIQREWLKRNLRFARAARGRTFDIETSILFLGEIAGEAGVRSEDVERVALMLPRDINHRTDYKRLVWADLSDEVQKLAQSYGYIDEHTLC